ncbi:L-rhamnose-binding lectin CSL3 isoform X2 [Danio rerio]|uniref:L-rhamnose-binding lectin CSL3 isoform X2 n=1 Tax=Danio rerio TaxID=7955 RepID=A0AB32TXR7_DANRE
MYRCGSLTLKALACKYESVKAMHNSVEGNRNMVSLCAILALLLSCSQRISAETVNTCMDSDLHLRCDAGVILVKSVKLGPQKLKGCGPATPPDEMYAMCFKLPPAAKWCNGLAECVVNKKKLLENDPCFNPYKYYITTYTCIPAKTSVTCEGKQSGLKCEYGRIKIIAANYGRTDDRTCLQRRPFRRHLNTDCYSPKSLALVTKRCEGTRLCSVSASNDVFSDPCSGTRKYLWISYYCS